MSKNTILSELTAEIAGLTKGTRRDEIGEVVRAGDGVAEIRGLDGVLATELIIFEAGTEEILGMALNLEEDSVKAVVLGEASLVAEGQTVRRTGQVLSISISDEIIGRVVDPLGIPKDGGRAFTPEKSKRYPLEKIAPGVITRQSVTVPLHTGIKAIDGMIPIGRGQRELIIGDRQTGKTAIAIDTIINQKKDTRNPTPICIYVAIGQKESKVAQIVEKLKEAGAMEYTIIVSASSSDPAPLQYLAPYAGAAIGEYFMDQGKDAVVVYDDLSKHARAYREISLLLRRPPGREAYPGDIFYLHSRLLERAARRNKEHGGGSVTALPIIETQLSDVSAYIPTNVISITDGQIYLEPELFHQGTRPAVSVGLSVSRVGSSAQTKAMKKVAGTMRLELAQFRELAAFAQFGQDLDPATKKKLDRGKRLTELLKQDEQAPVPFEEQVIMFYAAVNGYLDRYEVEEVRPFTEGLVEFIKKRHTKVIDGIREKGELAPEIIEGVKIAITDYGDNYFGKISS